MKLKQAQIARGPSFRLGPRYLPKVCCPGVAKDSVNTIYKEARLFRVWPLATERDGGSVAAAIPWELC